MSQWPQARRYASDGTGIGIEIEAGKRSLLRSSPSGPEDNDWPVQPRAQIRFRGSLEPGCVIGEVNGRPVGTARELERALASAESGSYLRLYVYRFGRDGRTRPFFAVVQVP